MSMIRNALAWLVLAPLAAIIVLLAVANRQPVMISLDPFLSEPRTLTVEIPLFILILASVIFGVVIGGIAAWLRQSKWRRHARVTQAELRSLRGEIEAMRHRLDTPERNGPSLPTLAWRRPPAA
jgi:uncharacterized integral membrane protein